MPIVHIAPSEANEEIVLYIGIIGTYSAEGGVCQTTAGSVSSEDFVVGYQSDWLFHRECIVQRVPSETRADFELEKYTANRSIIIIVLLTVVKAVMK